MVRRVHHPVASKLSIVNTKGSKGLTSVGYSQSGPEAPEVGWHLGIVQELMIPLV